LEGDAASTMSLAFAPAPANQSVPVDSDSGFPVAEAQHFQAGSVRVCLSGKEAETVEKFLAYFQASGKLKDHGVSFTPSMLFYGPPGCGKTQSARYIASQLNLPLIVARMDGVISSYLGSTAKNLRRLFEHAASTPCILFLDEFDALAKMRDDDRELGELKRVVISLLQNIDTLGPDHVLLAATNHEHLLDSAIWRRFKYKVHVGLPSQDVRSELLANFLGSYCDESSVDLLAAISDGMSGAQIEDLSLDAVRDAVLNDRNRIDAIKFIRELPSTLSNTSTKEALDMKTIVARLAANSVTQRRIADIFQVTQPRICQILKECKDGERN
jgi:SpoVK/Ycf46/Vps4 family AAA+-type ATPase